MADPLDSAGHHHTVSRGASRKFDEEPNESFTRATGESRLSLKSVEPGRCVSKSSKDITQLSTAQYISTPEYEAEKQATDDNI